MEHLAWPSAALVFGIFFTLLFKAPIRSFLSRVRSVGREGVSTGSAIAKESVEQQADAPDPNEVQTLLQTFDSRALLAQEQSIIRDLQSRNLDTTSDTTKVLVRHLARAKIVLGCEFVYRLIFGSQIALLKRINSGNGRITDEEAIAFYGGVSKRFPDVFPENEPGPYIDFLVKQGLVFSEKGHLVITDLGREFLIWLVQTGAPENRGF